MYMNQREYVQCEGTLEQIHGILYSEDWGSLLSKGKVLTVQLVVQFRHGKEEDEVMGVSFKKELIIDRKQINIDDKKEDTKFQSIMIKRLRRPCLWSLRFARAADCTACHKDSGVVGC